MKSSSYTTEAPTHLNAAASKTAMTVQSVLLLSLVQSEARPMRSAFWSAESEALPQPRALWSTEREASNDDKISISPPFLLNYDCELLLRSLRSLRSNNVSSLLNFQIASGTKWNTYWYPFSEQTFFRSCFSSASLDRKHSNLQPLWTYLLILIDIF